MKDLETIRVLKSNDRFDCFEAKLAGKKVFAKHAKSPKTARLLANQKENAKYIDKIGNNNRLPLRAPRTLGYDNDWLITEWVDTENLGARVKNGPKAVAEILSGYFLLFDNQKSDSESLRGIFTPAGLQQRIDERFSNLTLEQKTLIDSATDKFNQNYQILKPSWQDADIKPAHLYKDNISNGYILIDSEHLGSNWPRFYDIANNFAKYWVRDYRRFCGLLLSESKRKLNEPLENFQQSVVLIVIVRALSMLWSVDYESDISAFDKSKSYELLRLCVQAKSPENLL